VRLSIASVHDEAVAAAHRMSIVLSVSSESSLGAIQYFTCAGPSTRVDVATGTGSVAGLEAGPFVGACPLAFSFRSRTRSGDRSARSRILRGDRAIRAALGAPPEPALTTRPHLLRWMSPAPRDVEMLD
jgi:hypothetical protein